VWRVGARLMARRGGLIEVGIAQATVVTFGLLAFPTAETNTVCMGWRSRYAELMLTVVFADILVTLYAYCECLGLISFSIMLCPNLYKYLKTRKHPNSWIILSLTKTYE
jgi:hypothetical protein